MGEGRELCSQASLAIGPCASSSCSRPVCCLKTWPELPQEPPRKSCSRTSHPVSKDGCKSSCFCTEPPRRSCKKTYGARPVLGRRRRSLCSCNVGVPTLRQRGEGSMRPLHQRSSTLDLSRKISNFKWRSSRSPPTERKGFQWRVVTSMW